MERTKIKKTDKKKDLIRLIIKLDIEKHEIKSKLQEAQKKIDAFSNVVGKENFNEIMQLEGLVNGDGE
jgi:hypothetical protein